MIDIHAHILPDLDDGPATVEEALALARAAWDTGTRTIVATPHVLNRLNLANNTQILQRYKEFKHLLETELPGLNLYLGSEIYFQPHLSDLIYYEASTINGTRRYMLVEFPLGDIPRGFERELFALQEAEVIPVIAHPERNAILMNRPSLVGKVIDAGALVQLNAGSLTGQFGGPVKKLAHYLLKKGWVHVIASDAHDMRHRRPDLQKAVAAATEVIGAAAASRLVQDNPQMIVNGDPWPGRLVLDFLQGEEDD
jgi:protein-tyrosine phosphatase